MSRAGYRLLAHTSDVVLAAWGVFGIGLPKDWLELVVFTAAGVVCFASLGVALSHVIPNFESAAAYVNFVFLPVFVRDIAEGLPLKHLIDGLSGALVTGRGLSANLSALGVIAVWSALGLLLAIRGFSWDQRRA